MKRGIRSIWNKSKLRMPTKRCTISGWAATRKAKGTRPAKSMGQEERKKRRVQQKRKPVKKGARSTKHTKRRSR